MILIGVINLLTEVQVSYSENLILLIQIFYFLCLIRTVLHFMAVNCGQQKISANLF